METSETKLVKSPMRRLSGFLLSYLNHKQIESIPVVLESISLSGSKSPMSMSYLFDKQIERIPVVLESFVNFAEWN